MVSAAGPWCVLLPHGADVDLRMWLSVRCLQMVFVRCLDLRVGLVCCSCSSFSASWVLCGGTCISALVLVALTPTEVRCLTRDLFHVLVRVHSMLACVPRASYNTPPESQRQARAAVTLDRSESVRLGWYTARHPCRTKPVVTVAASDVRHCGTTGLGPHVWGVCDSVLSRNGTDVGSHAADQSVKFIGALY